MKVHACTLPPSQTVSITLTRGVERGGDGARGCSTESGDGGGSLHRRMRPDDESAIVSHTSQTRCNGSVMSG
eukprot:6200254-Pleurochrysis_carterae.AAC.1